MEGEKLRTGELERYPYFKLADVNSHFIKRCYRHAGGQLAIKLLKTNITANQVTILGFMFSIAAAATLLWNISYLNSLIAGILLMISTILDYADGSLARMKKQGSLLGAWLDSSLDNIKMIVLFSTIGLYGYFKTGNVYLMYLGFSGLIAFTTTKILLLNFARYFDKTKKVIEKAKKNKFAQYFYYTEHFIYTWLPFAMIIGKVEFFAIICGLYGWIFYAGTYVIFNIKAMRMNKILTEEEELHSK
jgi:phosphatidylglycerophosphate synthase